MRRYSRNIFQWRKIKTKSMKSTQWRLLFPHRACPPGGYDNQLKTYYLHVRYILRIQQYPVKNTYNTVCALKNGRHPLCGKVPGSALLKSRPQVVQTFHLIIDQLIAVKIMAHYTSHFVMYYFL